MLPQNRPELRVQIVWVKGLNGGHHYRLQVETPTMDLHTVQQWSTTGLMPVPVFEDLMASLYNLVEQRLHSQLQLP